MYQVLGKGRNSDIRYRIPDYEFLDPVTTTVAPSTTQSVSTTSSTTTTFAPDENPYDVVKYPDNAVVIPIIVGGGENWYGTGNKYYTDKLLETVSPEQYLREGVTYIFDQSHPSNSGHPLRFSRDLDGTHTAGKPFNRNVIMLELLVQKEF